jgi:hypothetical protein
MSREMKADYYERLPTAEIGSPRGGFGAALFDALHESRRRQAASVIHNYRHLIDEAKAYSREDHVMSTDPSFSQVSPQSDGKLGLAHHGARSATSGQMSVRTRIIIVSTLIIFAILHVIGGSLIVSGSGRIETRNSVDVLTD